LNEVRIEIANHARERAVFHRHVPFKIKTVNFFRVAVNFRLQLYHESRKRQEKLVDQSEAIVRPSQTGVIIERDPEKQKEDRKKAPYDFGSYAHFLGGGRSPIKRLLEESFGTRISLYFTPFGDKMSKKGSPDFLGLRQKERAEGKRGALRRCRI
jgi:hypothetical protein